MADNLASWHYEEDDTVAILSKTGEVRIGLISQTYDDQSSSDEDDVDDEDEDDRLKSGQVRVEWYPKGNMSAVMANKLFLLDRSILMGELICRRSQTDRVGQIRHIHVLADFLLLPQCQYVVRNVSDKRINFVTKFDDASSSSYVAFENWAGILTGSYDKLLLKTKEGYQCWLSTYDVEYDMDDLYDCCVKRLLDGSFNTYQWYEGEPVMCAVKLLDKVKWLPFAKPPDFVLRKMKNSMRKIKFTVLKVEPEAINVRWISAINGSCARIQPPPTTISGPNLDRVHKLDHFEHQLTEIGDRIWLEISPDDDLITYSEWKSNLRRQLNNDQGKKNAHVANGMLSKEVDAEDEMLEKAKEIDEINKNENVDNELDKSQTVSIADEDIQKLRLRPSTTSRRWGKHLVPNGLLLQKKSTFGKTKKVMHRPQIDSATASSSSTPKRPEIGEKFPGEAVRVRSYFDIVWQDGEIEHHVPSVDIGYVSGHLDEHLFIAGHFVLLHDDEHDGNWPEDGYGIVESVDYRNRVATVFWFTRMNPNEDATFIRKDVISVFELITHPEYEFAPGMLVMTIIADDPEARTLDRIGQILYVDTNGIHVKWMTGDVSCTRPEHICPMMDYYHADDDETEDEEEDDQDDQEDESQSGSWNTVSKENSDVEEENQCDKFDIVDFLKTAKHTSKDKATLLMKLAHFYDDIIGRCLSLSKDELYFGARRFQAQMSIKHFTMLKRLTKRLFGLDLKLHRYYGELFGCLKSIRIWLKAMEENDKLFNTKVSHPAKEAAVFGQDDIQNQADSRLAVLNQMEEMLGQLTDEAGEEAMAVDSDDNGETSTGGGRILNIRKALRSLLSRFQKQATESVDQGQSACATSSELDQWAFQLTVQMVENELKFIVTQLEQKTKRVEQKEFKMELKQALVRPDFLSVLDQSPGLLEINPTHQCASAIVDLLSLVILLIIRSVIEDLSFVDTTGHKPGQWEYSTPMNNDMDGGQDNGENQNDQNGPDMENCPDIKNSEKFILSESNNPQEDTTIDQKDDLSTPANLCSFELLESAPASHKFSTEKFDATSVPSRFIKAIRQEMKLLQTCLPFGIYVKAYENRMDLYSSMLVGPPGTPYENGLFFFDIRLSPQTYPNEPPDFHFKSFSIDQLNPNLYLDGKVCVSLLGTWSGKDSEVWNPGSNLLQVLVSIQGLILNAEPYFNEAGYETKKAQPESVEKSRRYNELALIRTIESLWKLSEKLPVGFESDVRRHLEERGRKLIENVNKWIEGIPCGFPLQPVSQGFVLSVQKQMTKLAQALSNMGF